MHSQPKQLLTSPRAPRSQQSLAARLVFASLSGVTTFGKPKLNPLTRAFTAADRETEQHTTLHRLLYSVGVRAATKNREPFGDGGDFKIFLTRFCETSHPSSEWRRLRLRRRNQASDDALCAEERDVARATTAHPEAADHVAGGAIRDPKGFTLRFLRHRRRASRTTPARRQEVVRVRVGLRNTYLKLRRQQTLLGLPAASQNQSTDA